MSQNGVRCSTGASEFPNLHEKPSGCWMRSRSHSRPMARLKSNSIRWRRCGLPCPSRQLRDRSDAFCSRPLARGRKSFSPILARPRTLPRARPSPRASSRPAASRLLILSRFRRKRSTPPSPPPSRRPAHNSSACAPRTKYMSIRPTAVAQAFHAAGVSHIYLTGRPGKQEAALRLAGVRRLYLHGRRRIGDAERRLAADWSNDDRSR